MVDYEDEQNWLVSLPLCGKTEAEKLLENLQGQSA